MGKVVLTAEQREIAKKIKPPIRKRLDAILANRKQTMESMLTTYWREATEYEQLQSIEGTSVAECAIYAGIGKRKWEYMVAVRRKISDAEFKSYNRIAETHGRIITEQVLEAISSANSVEARNDLITLWAETRRPGRNGKEEVVGLRELRQHVRQAKLEYGEIVETPEDAPQPQTQSVSVEKLFKVAKSHAAKLAVELQELVSQDVAGYMDGPVQKATEELRLQLLTLQELTTQLLTKLPPAAEEEKSSVVEESTPAGEKPKKEPVPKRVSKGKAEKQPKPVKDSKPAAKAPKSQLVDKATKTAKVDERAETPSSTAAVDVADMGEDELNAFLSGLTEGESPKSSPADSLVDELFGDLVQPSVDPEVSAALVQSANKRKGKTGPSKHRK